MLYTNLYHTPVPLSSQTKYTFWTFGKPKNGKPGKIPCTRNGRSVSIKKESGLLTFKEARDFLIANDPH